MGCGWAGSAWNLTTDWCYREVVSFDQILRNLTSGDDDCYGARL